MDLPKESQGFPAHHPPHHVQQDVHLQPQEIVLFLQLLVPPPEALGLPPVHTSTNPCLWWKDTGSSHKAGVPSTILLGKMVGNAAHLLSTGRFQTSGSARPGSWWAFHSQGPAPPPGSSDPTVGETRMLASGGRSTGARGPAPLLLTV